jgi:hypothetical protein
MVNLTIIVKRLLGGAFSLPTQRKAVGEKIPGTPYSIIRSPLGNQRGPASWG